MATQPTIPEAQRGPAEQLLDILLRSPAHLWHHRPGRNVEGVWRPAHTGRGRTPPAPRGLAKLSARVGHLLSLGEPTGAPGGRASQGVPAKPGLFLPAAEALYGRLLELWTLNPELAAHLASWAMVRSDWRDLQTACAALMLVQARSGQPVHDEAGAVAFHDDDHRAIGAAMLLRHGRAAKENGLTPKQVLRVAELLEAAPIAALNRRAGFGEPGSTKPPLGRYRGAATAWLRHRETNPALLAGLVAAGYKETIKKLARKVGYRPLSPAFFEVLGWKQKQAAGGHRQVGLTGLTLEKRARFDGLSEAEVCEVITEQRLSYKEAVGRLPKGTGLTPAIMAALLPSLSDRDLRQLTPTLEALGLLQDAEVRDRWERALTTATDQRALNIARNVKSKALQEKLEEAADHAARAAVRAAPGAEDLEVMFLVDKSGSMQGAIEQSREALSRILAGFPLERLHLATFDTMGTVLRPKAASRAAVTHLLSKVEAGGGTVHASAVRALAQAGLKLAPGRRLVVMVVGDEAGEDGAELAQVFRELGLAPAAMALLVSVSSGMARGTTVRTAAAALRVPFSEVGASQFDDPYQVGRVLGLLLEAPVPSAGPARTPWVDQVMAVPLLQVG
jgi:hypothetical protein